MRADLKFDIEDCVSDFIETVHSIHLVELRGDFTQHDSNVSQIIAHLLQNFGMTFHIDSQGICISLSRSRDDLLRRIGHAFGGLDVDAGIA